MTESSVAGDLSVARDGAVALLRMQRPPHNFFDVDMLRAIADALGEIDADPAVRISLLSAEGSAFCAGADFSHAVPASGAEIYGQAARIFSRKKPMVAAVQGPAIGGGLGLALAADFRVASPQARLQANFIRLGFHPGFALTVTLPRLVGAQIAADLLLSARRVDGEEALRLGLADRLVDADVLQQQALAFAADIAAGAPLSLLSIRAVLSGDLAEATRAAMAAELAVQERLAATEDFREGIAASKARRTPIFQGR